MSNSITNSSNRNRCGRARTHSITRSLTVGFTLIIVGGWSSCQPGLDQDPSFDLWCGESLCSWRTDSGSLQRVPTWIEDDYGVELTGSDTQISQLVTETGTQTPACLQFEMMTDLEADASVTLSLDFGDDGTIEYQAPVPATNWQSVTFSVTPPTWFPSVRFILHKTGNGKAILADLRVTAGGSCSGAPLRFDARPLAAPCSSDGECESGRCGVSIFPYVASDAAIHEACAGCKSDADCSGGEVCGVTIGALGMAAGCTAAGAKLGERCAEDGDCESSVCCGQVCSACCGAGSCGGGASCAETADPSNGKLLWVLRPSLCAPGLGEAAPGALCTADADCQSGTCSASGTLRECWIDGRRCQDDSGCPAASLDPSGKQPACIALGEDDGHCQ
jgi:hypothetical protein